MTKFQRHLQDMEFIEPRGAASMRTMGEGCSSETILISLGEKTVETDVTLCGDFSPTCDASPPLGSDIHPNETNLERLVLPNLIYTPTLKREKSMTDTIERKKKRVKFNPQDDDDEILVETHVFEEISSFDALIQDSDIVSNAPLASKLKRLLKSKSRALDCDAELTKDDSSSENEKGLCLKIRSKMASFENDDATSDSDCLRDEMIEKEDIFTKNNSNSSSENNEASVFNGSHLEGMNENGGLNFGNNAVSILGPLEVTADDASDDKEHDEAAAEKEQDIAFIDDGEEQEDELSKDDSDDRELKKVKQDITGKENNIEIEDNDEKINSTSLKREGTFTLEGSPPAKTMKPSTSLDNIIDHQQIMEEENERGQNTHKLSHKSSNETECSTTLKLVDSKPALQVKTKMIEESASRHRHVSFDEQPCVVEDTECARQIVDVAWVKPRRDVVELKADSLASKRRAKVNVEKRISSCDENEDIGADKTKSSSFRDSAKKTLINAWKCAMKGSMSHDNLGKGTSVTAENKDMIEESEPQRPLNKLTKNSTKRLCEQEQPSAISKTKAKKCEEITTFKSYSTEKSKSPTPEPSNFPSTKGAIPKTSKIRPFGNSNSGTSRTSSRSEETDAGAPKKPVVGTVLPLRRDGTFTKCPSRWARTFDGDRARLEAELRKFSAEKERLSAEATEARQKAEAEEAARKALRREQQQRVRRLREEEAAKRDLALVDLRNRLEEEHREALQQQKVSLGRASEAQLQRQEREHLEELRRARLEAKQEAERLKTEARKEAARPDSGSRSSLSATREHERLIAELTSLRDTKKRLEEALQRAQESEREHSTALRRAQSEHEGATAALVKQARHEQGKMMEELRARERTSAQLEKQLAQMASKLQLLKEESRARSEEKAEAVRRPLSRSNSSPGHQVNRSSSNKQSNNSSKAGNKGHGNKQDQQQRDDALTAEPDAGMSGWCVGEVARLKEEVEQQRRTIRQLSFRMPREGLYREDQPMSLGTLPSVSMDNMYEGLLRPAYNRGRSEPSPGSDWLSVIGDLREENRNLKSELQEARDQADLLEFRILELTEGSDRFSDSNEVCSVREVGGPDSPRDDPSGGNNAHCGGQTEDLSLPLSIDSGLDLTADCKKSRNIHNSTTSPKGGVSSTTSPASTTSTNYTNGNLNHPPSTNTDITMTETSSAGDSVKMEICGSDAISNSDHLEWSNKMAAEANTNKMAAEQLKSSELTELAARLQESLANADPKQQEEALLEAINKLRSLDGSLSSLQSRVVSLTDENQYLQEALSALSDAHETRTEASGTESEIVNNRKTPSLHSDLSDSESDSASSSDAGGGANRTNKRLEVTSSFQESGIFDGPCDVAHTGTQTEGVSEGGAPEAPQEDLSSAVARLTAIRSAMQGGGVHVRRHDLQDGGDESSQSKSVLGGDASQQDTANLVQALEQARIERQALQDAFDQLSERINEENRTPITPCRRCYETSEVDKGQSKVLREQLRISESSRKTLYDEKCELEEAENDARLLVQRLDSRLAAASEMELLLSASLSQEQEISRELHRKLKELQALEKERCLRQSVLERHSLSSVERVASLVMERDSYASQVSFVKMGLTLLKAFRLFQMTSCSLVPYTPQKMQLVARISSGPNSIRNIDRSQSAMEICDGSFDATSLTSSSSGGGASCVMVNCAIDEALMEMGDDSTVSTCSTPAFLTQTVTSSTEMDYTSTFNLDDMIISKEKFTEDFLVPGLCDMSAQTDPVRFFDEGESCPSQFASQQTDSSSILDTKDASTFPIVSDVSNVTLIQVQTSQIVQDSPVVAPVEKKSKSTMTIGEDLLSQRERYYLQQIETLQDEKMAFRKDQEQERQDQLQQCRALQAELEAVQDQLAEGERQRAMLQCRLEEAREQRETTGRDLHRRLEEMRGDMSRCSDLHEMEKKALRRDFDARLSEIGDDRRRCADRVHELEQQLLALRQELEVVGVAIVTDMTGFDGQPHSAAPGTSNTLASSSSSGDSGADPTSPGSASDPPSSLPPLRINSASDLLDRIRQLIKSESALRKKISDFEEKELAYQNTLGRADQIMLARELEFKQRIVELEEINEQCAARIRLLEKNEDRLRSSLKAGSRTDQDDKINDLLQKIIDSEKNELALQDKLYKLEKCEKELRIKLMEGEKVQQSLRSELREQEDMLAKMRNLQAENSAITHQLQQAHNNVRRVVELQQSERFLRGRVEELETSEHSLKETLQQTENSYCARERRLREQVSCLKEDISSFKSQLESLNMRETEARDIEVSLRKQVEALKSKLEESQQNLKESSAETISTEAQCRNEMVKLRTQLKLVNSQLADLDGISCSLRERLAASEQLREALEQQLEERKRRHESDLLQLNLQASQRESRLEETEGQLCELTQLHAAQELDLLASSALAPMLRAAHGAAAKLKLCEVCSTADGGSMAELKAHLSTLMDLLNGAPQSDTEDNEGDESDGDDIADTGRSEALYVTTVSLDPSTNGPLGSVTSSTSSPNHFASRLSSSTSITIPSSTPSSSLTNSDCLSTTTTIYGDDDSSASSSLRPNLSESPDSCRPGSPVPVPAPRRKRKQKREDTTSLRGSFRARKKGNTTILEELEEKVRELEESTAKKEEELRLADSEAAELNSRLQELTAAKEAEVCEFRRALSDLQQQLVLSIECREVNKIKLEAKYKADEESMAGRVQKLTEQLERLADRGRLKDHIIATLVTQIRAILRTTNLGVVLTQIRQIDQRRELSKLRRLRREEERLHRNQATMATLPKQARMEEEEEETDEEQDFDVETVCDLLNRPREVTEA